MSNKIDFEQKLNNAKAELNTSKTLLVCLQTLLKALDEEIQKNTGLNFDAGDLSLTKKTALETARLAVEHQECQVKINALIAKIPIEEMHIRRLEERVAEDAKIFEVESTQAEKEIPELRKSAQTYSEVGEIPLPIRADIKKALAAEEQINRSSPDEKKVQRVVFWKGLKEVVARAESEITKVR